MKKLKPVLSPEDLNKTLKIAGEKSGESLRIPKAGYFLESAEETAKLFLGDYLFRIEKSRGEIRLCGGRIVETEAYLGKTDPASHAATSGITERNKIFYEKGGLAYVFKSRGIYCCFNVIVCPKGQAGCVLIRALEPAAGIKLMAARRGKSRDRIFELCSGPGKICQAFGIDIRCTGYDLRKSPILILTPAKKNVECIDSGPRIGITKAAEIKLRFWMKDSKYISG
jgi:DNA-3-methyladenine glycosylase